MLRIRLARTGKKNKAQFRLVVAEKARAANKKFIEILGHYNPHSKEKVFKKERVQYWISKGAQPSATVHNFLIDLKIIKGKKVISWKPKKKVKENKEDEKKVEEKKVEKAEPKENESENNDKEEKEKPAVKE